MHTEILNILCYSNNVEIARLIDAVYTYIPHELTLQAASEIEIDQSTGSNHDLIIIDNSGHEIQATSIRKIHLMNESASMILIENNKNNMTDWADLHHLHYISSNDVTNRLPLVLSKIFTEITNESSDFLPYWQTIQTALNETGSFVAIVDAECKIIFINQIAEQLLGIVASQYIGTALTDFITDGAKVWNYIQEKIGLTERAIENYQILFLDIHSNEHPSRVEVKKIDTVHQVYLIHTRSGSPAQKDMQDADYQILNKFADSIANELLNPVNIISGRLQLLGSEAGENENIQRSLASLSKQVNRISDTVSKLLTFARLKRDTIPQKIHVNEIIQRLSLDPAVNKMVQETRTTLQFHPGPDIPILSGLISHFDLMIKTLIELSIYCLGSSGQIELKTAGRSQSGRSWVDLIMSIKYAQPLFGKDETIQAYMGSKASLRRVKSLESTIVFHIIRQYDGNFQVDQQEDDTEEIILSFPASSSFYQMEVK